MKNKRTITLLAIVIVLIGAILYVLITKNEKPTILPEKTEIPQGTNELFDYTILKKANEHYDDNYMISPVSISYALGLLKDSASDTLSKEIETLLNNYQYPKINNIKNRISIANALFIKNDYKNKVNNDTINNLKNTYNAEIIYDEFKTPDTINNWVNEKTFEMIPKLYDELSDEALVVLANALAIDVEWRNQFECYDTHAYKFKNNNEVAMMSSKNDFQYIKNDNAIGIIKDYAIYDKDGNYGYDKPSDEVIKLEYIAIMPNDIKSYVSNFSKEELDSFKVQDPKGADLILNIPKYKYETTYNDFKDDLISLGLKHLETDNLDKLFNNMDLTLSSAIHKTNIDLSENGTKAAAVTAFMYEMSAMPEEKEEIVITFDKPFMYLIKEKNSDNIWFAGVVYNPTNYKDHTCETKNSY